MNNGHHHLRCLGVGPGWPCPDRSASSFVYDWGPLRLLCDCGEPLSRNLKTAAVPLESIDFLALTHLHFDHLGGLFFFLQGCWVEERTRPLTIHLPGHGIPAVREILRQGFVFDALLRFPLRWEAWTPGQPATLGQLRITPFPTTHLDQLLHAHPDQMPADGCAFSLLMEGNGRRVVHSGDLGAPEDLTPLLDRPVDLLVCELAHFEPERLFEFLGSRPVRRLLLIHLSGHLWTQRKAIRARAARCLPHTAVEVAIDGTCLEF